MSLRRLNSATSLKISVVICTHNGRRYIEQQLESVLSQTLTPYEILISDDASTDGTMQLALEFLKSEKEKNSKLSKIRIQSVAHSAHLGISRNFEFAMKAATGDLIALCDQDDVWLPNKLFTLAKLFETERGVLLVHTDSLLVDANLRSLRTTSFELLKFTSQEKNMESQGVATEFLLRRNVVTGATVVLRPELLQYALPIPDSYLHDEWLGLVASALGAISYSGQTTILYRQHESNSVGLSRRGLIGKIAMLFAWREPTNKILFSRATAITTHPFFIGCDNQQITGLVAESISMKKTG